jgi:hypothetical protein
MSKANVISSWADLTRWLERYQEQGWLFRGEANASHGALKPRVGRVSQKRGFRRKPYTMSDERRAFEEFKKLARPHLKFEPRSEIEWLSIAQHHGLPTRLIDWTANLFVAAFFAVELAGKAHGVIYCVRGVEEIAGEAQDEAEDIFALDSVRVYHPPALSPRVFAQQSVFTLHPHPEVEFTCSDLERWIVQSDACWPIKRSLSAAGVNWAALFPDIDGLCKHLGWLYKWSYFDGFADSRRGDPSARV